jgi:L-ascorbate metabolism protein UlaG (beta-lactamase superfamily)
MKPEIKWLGHSTVMLKGEKLIVIDPWKLENEFKADLVLLTHSHFDHLSPDDIRKILQKNDPVIGTHDCFENLKEFECKPVKPGDTIDLGWVKVEAVPAYNPNKEFHPKANSWVGYIIHFEGTSVYIAGDTDHIPEMKDIKADIAILPVGGTYTMSVKEAAAAAHEINPKIAIPIHYGDIVGNAQDGKDFAKLMSDSSIEVKVLEPEKTMQKNQ